jgi:hypothetical protein
MADDKKKITRKAPEAQGPGGTQTAGGTQAAGKIVFHCSNGHRIVVSAEIAGQRGKCSKCGVAVRIPTASEPQPAAPPPAQAVEVAEETPGDAESAEQAVAPEEGVGIAAGQPTVDGDGEEAVGHAEPPIDMFAGLVDSGDSRASATEFGGFSTQQPQVPQQDGQPVSDGDSWPTVPTAALVARLFEEMEHGGIIEVHINGGSVILPEFYEPRWSRGSHGLFASRAADGTVTLTAVAWESIQKIVVRQVEGLPDGLFE